MVKAKSKNPTETVLLSEIELLLAEKRTYFALLRTGIAVATLPLTIAIFLMATKDYHNLFDSTLSTFMTVIALIAIAIGGMLMAIISSKKIKKINIATKKVESENKRIEDIIV